MGHSRCGEAARVSDLAEKIPSRIYSSDTHGAIFHPHPQVAHARVHRGGATVVEAAGHIRRLIANKANHISRRQVYVQALMEQAEDWKRTGRKRGSPLEYRRPE